MNTQRYGLISVLASLLIALSFGCVGELSPVNNTGGVTPGVDAGGGNANDPAAFFSANVAGIVGSCLGCHNAGGAFPVIFPAGTTQAQADLREVTLAAQLQDGSPFVDKANPANSVFITYRHAAAGVDVTPDQGMTITQWLQLEP